VKIHYLCSICPSIHPSLGSVVGIAVAQWLEHASSDPLASTVYSRPAPENCFRHQGLQDYRIVHVAISNLNPDFRHMASSVCHTAPKRHVQLYSGYVSKRSKMTGPTSPPDCVASETHRFQLAVVGSIDSDHFPPLW